MMGPWFYKMISILPGLTSVKWQTKLILAKVNVGDFRIWISKIWLTDLHLFLIFFLEGSITGLNQMQDCRNQKY